MYKILKVLAGIAIVSMFSISSANAAMTGGKHDLTDDTAVDINASGIVGTELCRFCHTPHNSQTLAPLWDRAASGEASFTMYTSPSGTMNGTPGLSGVSGGCMSCHDGTTAFDAVNGYAGTDGDDMEAIFIDSPAILGADLGNDHPIGMAYVGDPQISGSAPTPPYKIFGTGTVECASCHDVHDNTAGWKMLRSDPATTDICGACHTK